jgi:hypothetical protein
MPLITLSLRCFKIVRCTGATQVMAIDCDSRVYTMIIAYWKQDLETLLPSRFTSAMP